MDRVQLVFTKNRCILDSVAYTREILAASHNSNIETIFLKLDFEKTFDSVSWDFLIELLLARELDIDG